MRMATMRNRIATSISDARSRNVNGYLNSNEIASIAIKTIRDPTPKMIAAGLRVISIEGGGSVAEIEEAFRAMIDAC
jgi:hypothetical protein